MRCAGPTVRHAQPGALVAYLEQVNSEIVQGFHPVHVAVAHHAEDGADTLPDERLRQTLVHLHPLSDLRAELLSSVLLPVAPPDAATADEAWGFTAKGIRGR